MIASIRDFIPTSMIRRCDQADIAAIEEIINQAAAAYRGVIPDD